MIRKLRRGDVGGAYFELLCQLSGEVRENYNFMLDVARFWPIYQGNNLHQIFVYEDEGEIVGTATLLVENKLLHYGSRVGHIEDVVVNKHKRLKGVGRELIEKCVEHAKYTQCYKIILDCSDDNVPFYESCGFRVAERCMRLDL